MTGARWLRTVDTDDASADSMQICFDLHLSPYQIPEAVRGLRKRDRFRIEFKYIDGKEPSGPEQELDEHVSVFHGRHTNRLLAIEVDVEGTGAQSVGVNFIPHAPESEKEWETMLESLWKVVLAEKLQPKARESAEIAHQAALGRRHELYQQLAAQH